MQLYKLQNGQNDSQVQCFLILKAKNLKPYHYFQTCISLIIFHRLFYTRKNSNTRVNKLFPSQFVERTEIAQSVQVIADVPPYTKAKISKLISIKSGMHWSATTNNTTRVCKFYRWVESLWLVLHKFWSHFGIFGVKYHDEKSHFQTFQHVVLACIHYREGYTK